MAELYSGVRSSPHLAHRQQSGNCVLVKDEIGRGRASCRDLPPADHAYGNAEPWSPHGEGVRDALTWVEHTPSPDRRPWEVDFHNLHRAAVTHTVEAVTPKKLSRFRATHGDFVRGPREPRRTAPPIIPSDVIPHWTYGKPGRPSTPIGEVMANRAGQEAEDVIEEQYHRYEEQRAKLNSPLKFKMTKAEKLRRQCRQEKERDASQAKEPGQLWQMSKFRKVPPQLQQESPLYRDAEGRLRRCQSPALKASVSLPSLSQAHPAAEATAVEDDTLDWWEVSTKEGKQAEDAAEGEDLVPTDASSHCAEDDATISDASSSPRLESSVDAAIADGEGDCSEVSFGNVDAAVTSAETTPAPASRGKAETQLKLLLAVRHRRPEELDVAMATLQHCIRSSYSDSVVKIQAFTVDGPRQSERERRKRFMAWGQGAIKEVSSSEASTPCVLSPVKLTLLLRHTSIEELRETAGSLADCICARFGEKGDVQLRKMHPPLWLPPPSPPVQRPLRDGLGRRLPMS